MLAKQMKPNKVVIACFKRDLPLVRWCVASVRYWHPEAEIYLLKDNIRGSFSTAEIEKHWDVRVFESSRTCFGWPWSKLAVILQKKKEKYLFLDSDTVMLGRVLDSLNQFDDDFVVTGARGEADSKNIKDNYVDLAAMKAFDPAYQFPGFGFNGGQILMTSGLLTEADFTAVINFEPNITNRFPKMLKHGDQGALNYVLTKAQQQGKITVRYADFWLWPGQPEANSIDLQRIRRKDGTPFVLHWAGIKPTDFRRYLRYDIIRFYEDFYYSRVQLGGLKRLARYCVQLLVVKLKITKYKLLGMPYQ